jgi:hypothetical protein
MAGTRASGTGVVNYDSILVRNGWMLEGLVQARSTSFWDGLTGTTSDAVIYQKNDFSATEGHEIRFQFDGNLTSKAKIDKEQAWGNSEQKKLFSDKLRVRRLRWSVDNGDAFDAVNVGDLSISEHTDSRAKLADLFIRAKDQMIFDAAQGLLNNEGPTHRILPNGKTDIGSLTSDDVWDYDFVLDVEDIIKSGKGYSVGGSRRPLEPYKLADGKRAWLVVIDSRASKTLRQDTKFIDVTAMGDVRGENNRLIKGVIGKIGSLIFIEADTAFGVADATIGKSEVEIAGLRHVDSTGLFEGQPGYGAAGTVEASRAIILGRSAIQIGFGKQPDYKWQESQDFGIKSESALEVWMNVQKTVLKAEGTDYEEAKVAGFDFGVVVVDTFFRAN